MMEFGHNEEHIDEKMVLLQANLDDMNPEYCSFIMDKLFEGGANDVFWIPIIMKKGRPGNMLNVYVDEKRLDEVKEIVFKETTTLGLRYWKTNCHRLGREFIKVETPWGNVEIKLGIMEGQVVQYAPEFRDCEQIAQQYQIPLKQVYDTVRHAYMKLDE